MACSQAGSNNSTSNTAIAMAHSNTRATYSNNSSNKSGWTWHVTCYTTWHVPKLATATTKASTTTTTTTTTTAAAATTKQSLDTAFNMGCTTWHGHGTRRRALTCTSARQPCLPVASTACVAMRSNVARGRGPRRDALARARWRAARRARRCEARGRREREPGGGAPACSAPGRVP